MDTKRSLIKIGDVLKKYKYACIVLLAGILLMLLPVGGKTTQPQEKIPQEKEAVSIEDRLVDILGQIRGAGRVRVMLTVASGEETIYQSDQNQTTDGNGSTSQKDTVTVTDKDRGQSGLIMQVNPPKYQGALVVCQGADDAAVRLAIAEAVSGLTGLGMDKITIAKMK
ncbi:MAG: stage III sporulation protein AG [Ruminococcaceae bacterium]|nr:stage III sporulation protein AG [Oscillospiraceae bacterium]